MAQRNKKSRHTWTDQEKEELIVAASTLPRGGLYPWLRERRIAGGWFAQMRKRYLADHPDFVIPAAPPIPVVPLEIPPEAPLRQGAIDFRTADDATKRKLVAEYQTLPNFTGAKEEWLKAHGTNMASFHWYRAKLDKSSKTPSTALSVRAAKNGRKNRFDALQMPDILPSPPAHTVTLNDAICALEVKRDHYNEMIEELKRMRDGRR